MAYSHVILGGIGVVVETSDLQLQSFNEAFANLGIDFIWTKEDYQASLSSAGGANRLRRLSMADGSSLSSEQVQAVHEEKTRLLGQKLASQGVGLRDGIADVISTAKAKGMTLAWATTTSSDNIDAICHASDGAVARSMFAFIGDESMVGHSKPDSEIYKLTLEKLGIPADAALAIEDSPTGVASAKNAALFTAAFPGTMNADKDFAEADVVVTSATQVVPLLG